MPDFATDSARFNLRVAGVCIEAGKVLLHSEDRIDFWVLPGGRPMLGETAADGLRREMMEEIAADVEVGRLLWVVENLFTFEGEAFHEIGFYFAMKLPAGLRRALACRHSPATKAMSRSVSAGSRSKAWRRCGSCPRSSRRR